MLQLLRGALAQRMRLVRTAAAVALAVSLVSGTFVLTDTINSAYHEAAMSSGGIDVVVRATSRFNAQGNALPEREVVPESLLAVVQSVPGVAALWGSVSGYAELVDDKGRSLAAQSGPAIGTAWTPDGSITAGRAPSGSGEIAIDEALARQDGLKVGDRIKVLFQGLVEEFKIAGLRKLEGLLANTQATFDLQTAQRVFGQEGAYDAIPVRAVAGVSPETLRARIGAVLPDRYEVVTYDQAAKEAAESWTKALGFLTTALLLFAAVALLVGAFIIFNTFSILVAQRTRQLGLLRALGASRSHVIASVLAEAVLVGVAASVVGIVLGVLAAKGLLALMAATGFDLPPATVAFRARTVLICLATGIGVTVAAAVVPALRATRVSPLSAANGRAEDADVATRRRLAFGAAVAVAGVASLFLGLYGRVHDPLVPIGLGAGGVLLGLAMLISLVAAPAARLLGLPLIRVFGQPALLGRENAMRNPRRTAATAAALMIGITLVGVVSILAASMKASASAAVNETLRADFVVAAKGSNGGGSATFSPVVADRLRKTKEVGLVSEFRTGQWGLNGATRTLIAVDPRTVTEMHDLDPATASAAGRLDDEGVLVRASIAERHGWHVGDEVPMTFARTGTRSMRLVDTFANTTVRSDFVISLGAYKGNYAQQLDAQVEVRLKDGVSTAAGRVAVEKALAEFPTVEVMDRSQVLAAQEKQVDTLLVPVTALLALSVVIALLGIANTLALSIHERTREVGLLRAVGMGRGQLRSMVRTEAMIVAGLGAILGVGVAVFFGWALVSAMHDLGVTELVVPVGQLSFLVAAATGAGLLAGVLPARRAARLGVLDAIAGR
jgi:putative ABC transport system permease protein